MRLRLRLRLQEPDDVELHSQAGAVYDSDAVGIILITFVLFNMVGEDPALAKLEQGVTQTPGRFRCPARIYKPLLAGFWARHARTATRIKTNAGPWTMIPGVVREDGSASIKMKAGAGICRPARVQPLRRRTFKWDIVYTLRDDPGRPGPSLMPRHLSW